DERQDFLPAYLIESGERFVHQDETGSRQERTGERHALRLAARERCRAPRREGGEAEALDHGFDRPRRPRAAGGVGEVAAHVEMREEPGLLEHRGDAAAVRGNEAPAVLPDLV